MASTLEEVLPEAYIGIQLCPDHTFQVSALDPDGTLISSHRTSSNLVDDVHLAVAMAVIAQKLRK